MMALLAMAVHDTEDNGRSRYTDKTIESLIKTVDFEKHRLFIIDNGSCEETQRLYERLVSYWALNQYEFTKLTIIKNKENVGTAKAINQAWVQRGKGENCIKMDNDIVIHSKGWVDEMEEAIAREPRIGQIGLKRKDIWEYPTNPNNEYRSTMIMLPHKPGERWIMVEKVKHVIGTCVMHSADLLDKVGYLFQPGVYGYDDVDFSWRANLAGFITCFLSHINLDHIDTGGTDYQKWKERHAGEYSRIISDTVDKYISGEIPLYREP